MNTVKNLMDEIQGVFDEMTDILDEDSSIEMAVEVGSTLAAVIKRAGKIQNDIKNLLRAEALDELNHAPGTAVLEGSGWNKVAVTVPRPKLRMAKSADLEIIRKVLGDDFDLYLETVISYKPRPTTGDLIAAMDDGPAKTILIAAFEMFEGTPRVSFK